MSNLTVLTEQQRAELRLNNPTNEICFFIHNQYKHRNPKKRKTFAYILMSQQISIERFNGERGLFPDTTQITEQELDELLIKHKDLSVIFVGDQEILDEHFAKFNSKK